MTIKVGDKVRANTPQVYGVDNNWLEVGYVGVVTHVSLDEVGDTLIAVDGKMGCEGYPVMFPGAFELIESA